MDLDSVLGHHVYVVGTRADMRLISQYIMRFCVHQILIIDLTRL